MRGIASRRPRAAECHQKSHCPRLTSLSGKAFARRKVRRPVHRACHEQEWPFVRFPGSLKFQPNDAATRKAGRSSSPIQPLREVLREPYRECVTHLLQM